jgi:hypothetical protein
MGIGLIILGFGMRNWHKNSLNVKIFDEMNSEINSR